MIKSQQEAKSLCSRHGRFTPTKLDALHSDRCHAVRRVKEMHGICLLMSPRSAVQGSPEEDHTSTQRHKQSHSSQQMGSRGEFCPVEIEEEH